MTKSSQENHHLCPSEQDNFSLGEGECKMDL